MLTIQKGKIVMNDKTFVYCVKCIRDITQEAKVEIKGDLYCSHCAAEYYEDLKVL